MSYLEPLAIRDYRDVPFPTVIEETAMDVIRCFADVEESDPRMMIVLGASRIEQAIYLMFRTYLPEFPKISSRFSARVNSLFDNGIIDRDYGSALKTLWWLRNRICHAPTSRSFLLSGKPWEGICGLHSLSKVVPVWSSPVHPVDDLNRSVFASMVATVLVAELDFFSDAESDGLMVKGFNALAARC